MSQPTDRTTAGASPAIGESLATGDKSLGELVSAATADLSLLVHQEISLAKAEIKRDVTAAGKGAGLFGGAGFTGLLALLFLSIALAFALGSFTTLGVGFLLVGVLYLLAAIVLALTGKKKISQVGPPEQTIKTVKDDVAWAKHPTQAP